MRPIGLIKFILFILLSFYGFLAQAENGPFPAQMLMNVYQSPSPLKADDKYFLVYEIYLTNYMKEPAKLTSFTVNGENKKDLLIITDLKNAIKTLSAKNQKDNLYFEPGESKIVFVWIPFDNAIDIPKVLSHQLILNSSYNNQDFSFQLGNFDLPVNNTAPVIVSPPLRGQNWLAGNAPSNTANHRRAGIIFNGKPYYPQRYAIDFVQVGKDGTTYSGDIYKNTSYYCYNQDILAVADGTIVQLQDGIPENIPNSNKHAVQINQKTVPGNYLVIDLGNGHYAGYAHIIPGSFKVKIGDQVKRNQVIAKLGNSGNSSEPHLHFQIMNDKSFLISNGIPYGFDHFFAHPSQTIESTINVRIKVSNENFKEYSNQLMLENALVNWGSSANSL